MSRRQLSGIALAVAAVAATIIVGPLHWTAQEKSPQPVVAPAQVEPDVVALARKALAQDMPARLRFEGGAVEVERLPSGRALICLSASECALVRDGAERVLVNTEPGARQTLLEAAAQGEPR